MDDMELVEAKEIQNAVLVGITLPRDKDFDLSASLDELKELALAAGANVVFTTFQHLKKIEAPTYIGSGKVVEIKEIVEDNGANLVIFNDELSGSQIRNLEEIIGVRVIDRTALILDIFALRAESHIAKLQVSLAQSKYRLPRLIGLGTEMSKTGGGIGTRGPGEQKLEIDRRRINETITDIEKRLQESIQNRQTTKKQRQKNNIPVVALVGYTNAGKSSVMNRFIDKFCTEDDKKPVFEKNMLFATLDSFHRKISIDEHKMFILTDTVGFVDKLPHSLVEAFKATLEDAIDADLLIHVVDAANFTLDMQFETTRKILKELGAIDKKIITIFNKCDLLDGEGCDERADIYTSMKDMTGFDELVATIDSELFSNVKIVDMFFSYSDGNILNEIMSTSKVNNIEYLEDGTKINVELNPLVFSKYEKYVM